MRRIAGTARRWVAVALAVPVVFGTAGCRTPQAVVTPDAGPVQVRGTVEPEVAARLAEAQDLRLERLTHLHRLGTASLTWTDADGSPQREPQLEMTLFHRRPADTAIELRKFGIGTIFWMGSDINRWWVFDLRPGNERSLSVGAIDDESDAQLLPPSAVPMLLGLSAFPRDPARWRRLGDGRLSTRLDGEGDVTVRALLFLDEASGQPRRVEVARVGSRQRLIATLDEDVWVDVGGVAPFDRPRLPHHITIVRDDGAFRLELRLDAPEGTPPEGRWDRLFDLNGLTDRYRPERIDGPWPP